MDELAADDLEELLHATGELIAASGQEVGIVVVGGATLSVRGVVERVTKDVDVIALAESHGGAWRLLPPTSLPSALTDAVTTVARDFGVAPDWLNAVIGAQWSQGLPPSLPNQIEWRTYAGLHVGYVGRAALIALKLFAAVDRSPASVHFQDLVALRPTDAELVEAKEWVLGQDAGDSFPSLLLEVVEAVREHR